MLNHNLKQEFTKKYMTQFELFVLYTHLYEGLKCI